MDANKKMKADLHADLPGAEADKVTGTKTSNLRKNAKSQAKQDKTNSANAQKRRG